MEIIRGPRLRAHADRAGLAAALSHRRGDTLVVRRLDRLGRTTHQLASRLEQFEAGLAAAAPGGQLGARNPRLSAEGSTPRAASWPTRC